MISDWTGRPPRLLMDTAMALAVAVSTLSREVLTWRVLAQQSMYISGRMIP